ncbi:TPA: hypothetical protein RQK36_000275 [Vibrio vulnificus]|nr:hypothetical protein [Vibrio vulnificus]
MSIQLVKQDEAVAFEFKATNYAFFVVWQCVSLRVEARFRHEEATSLALSESRLFPRPT